VNIDPRCLPEAVRKQYRDQLNAEVEPSRARRLQGRQAQAAGGDFEAAILKLCELYETKRVAHLARMPVPTAPAPRRGQRARGLRVLSGQAPFDLYGWTCKCAQAVGVELKSTAKKERRLPIVGEGKKGSGIQKHQLDALASLAGCGGVARIVWSNGGEIGVLSNDDILQAQALYAEGGRGTRSIPWGWFRAAEGWNWLALTAEEGKP